MIIEQGVVKIDSDNLPTALYLLAPQGTFDINTKNISTGLDWLAQLFSVGGDISIATSRNIPMRAVPSVWIITSA